MRFYVISSTFYISHDSRSSKNVVKCESLRTYMAEEEAPNAVLTRNESQQTTAYHVLAGHHSASLVPQLKILTSKFTNNSILSTRLTNASTRTTKTPILSLPHEEEQRFIYHYDSKYINPSSSIRQHDTIHSTIIVVVLFPLLLFSFFL
jgi:hypothetical protein